MITRVYPAGWGVGEKLTSGQLNGIDTALTYALDKRAGQTDTLESVVSCATAGRIIRRMVTGPDSNTSLLAAGGTMIDVPTLTAQRTYTFSNTGAVAGDIVIVSVRAASNSVVIKDAAATTLITLGAVTNSASVWAEFYFTGSAWVLGPTSGAKVIAGTPFTSSGNFLVPAGCTSLLVWGFGAGGGGAGGAQGASTNSNFGGMSGGGGGSAAAGLKIITGVTAGDNYTVTVPAGGAGGAAGLKGSDGGNAIVTGPAGTVTFRGGQGGGAYSPSVTLASGQYFVPGGGPSGGTTSGTDAPYVMPSSMSVGGSYPSFGLGLPGFHFGGPGKSAGAGTAGTTSPENYAGGAGGAVGTTASAYQGGPGGGGGAGGPGGVGGAGGAGGNASSSGNSGAGSPGTAAGANTGAGGGGGGAGGAASGTGGAGGAGGTGGSAAILIIAFS